MRQIKVDLRCGRCRVEPENIEHILFFCPFAKAVWFGSNLACLIPRDEGARFYHWVLNWGSLSALDKQTKKDFITLCTFVAWFIWCSRNDDLFGCKVSSPIEVLIGAKKACDEFLSATQQTSQVPLHNTNGVAIGLVTPTVNQVWCPPPHGFFKLHCDASFVPGKEFGGVGFLLRNHLGHPRFAVSSQHRFSCVIEGEAIAVREGLLEAISEGTYQMLVESDNRELISYLQDSSK
ncbi:uncharacterized protein LOC122649236 [Telopea speciosissima]|uniref:uncharacterized protein LOC122649236 n=1 Tax=Telopea speciosissima TaxID=54955 RepID=UPI001CC45948|nr:uncharacterized protein LOC122649236 [Telopea speciosissima]